jgi:hypothetical protein
MLVPTHWTVELPRRPILIPTATRTSNLNDSDQLTLILLTWRIWWAPNNASSWQMGFNSVFKGLSVFHYFKCHTKVTTYKENTVELVWNVMAYAQKPEFVFHWNGRVRLNRRGSQFSWLLAAEVCASASAMLDTPRSEVVWEYWLPTPFASFSFISPLVCHRVPSGFKRATPQYIPTLWGKQNGTNVISQLLHENDINKQI